MKRIRLLFLTVSLFLAEMLCLTSFAAEPVWTVVPDVAALSDLQQAITNAGTTPTNIPLSADITLTGTAITIPANAIIKLTGAGQYKIDANQFSGVIIVSAGATLYLQDITITGGNLPSAGAFTDPGPANSGGGIFNNGELNIQSGALITGNTTNDGMSNHGGGGLFNAKGATVFMTGGEISGNTAGNGGGVFNAGAFNLSDGKINNNYANYTDGGVTNYSGAVFTMTGGEISNNTANTASVSCYGGGVGNNNGRFDMSGGVISGNKGNRGGGVCNQGTFNLSGSAVISGNSSTSSGGGINNTSMGTIFGTLTMTGGEISGNKLTATSGGTGAGVYNANGAPFYMSGGKISGNTIANSGNNSSGGGVYNAGLFTLSGGEISGHSLGSNSNGGGVYNSGTFNMLGDAVITNNIAQNGGGIYQAANILSIRGNSSLTYNKVTIGKGGAIYIPNIANLYVDAGVRFANNQAVVAAPTITPADMVTHSTHILTSNFSGSFTNGYNNWDISYNSGTAPNFVGVTDITGVPAAIPLNLYMLSGTVSPVNATINKIFWTMKDAGTTGAYIDGSNILTPSAAGIVIITATIYLGIDPFTDFTKDFTIIIGDGGSMPQSITWTGAENNQWTNVNNWSSRIPKESDDVLIPVVATHYPQISSNVTITNLVIEQGASIDLNGNSLNVTAKIQIKSNVSTQKWLAVGFPFAIEKLYSEWFEAEGWSADLLPYNTTAYSSNFYGDYWLREYAFLKTPFSYTQTWTTGKGYIIQFPEWFDTDNRIIYLSEDNQTISEKTLDVTTTYQLFANPTLKPLNLIQGVDNKYYYKLNSAGTVFEKPTTVGANVVIEPFESVIAVQEANIANLRSSLSVNEATGIIHPDMQNDPVVVQYYYTLQGIRIEKPNVKGIYIVRQILQSGREKSIKIWYNPNK